MRELKPALRDQLMVSERDRVLNEWRARRAVAVPRHPWRQVMRADIVASALGVSLLLLVYYTTVAFGVIYLVTVFGFSPGRANALLNWSWAANAAALLVAGLWSDAAGVRKPFMLVGGAVSAGMIWLFLGHGFRPSVLYRHGAHPAARISAAMGFAYATWMAQFHRSDRGARPGLDPRPGWPSWGLGCCAWWSPLPSWRCRMWVTTVTVLVEAPGVLAALRAVEAAHTAVPPELGARLAALHSAVGATAGQ